MSKIKNTTLQVLEFSGYDTAALKLEGDRTNESARGQIFKATMARINSEISAAAYVEYINDYRDCIKVEGGTAAQLNYALKQAKVCAKGQGFEIVPKSKTLADKSMRYVTLKFNKVVVVDEDEGGTDEDEGGTDEGGEVIDGKQLTDIMSDRLDQLLQSGLSRSQIIRAVLDKTVETAQQADTLRSLADTIAAEFEHTEANAPSELDKLAVS